MGLKNFAVLYPDSSYGRTFLQIFQNELAAQGGGELWFQAQYASGTKEFAPLMATMKDALQGPAENQEDIAIFIPDDAAAVAAIAGQLAGRLPERGAIAGHQPAAKSQDYPGAAHGPPRGALSRRLLRRRPQSRRCKSLWPPTASSTVRPRIIWRPRAMWWSACWRGWRSPPAR